MTRNHPRTHTRPRRPEGRPPYNLPFTTPRRGGIHPSRAAPGCAPPNHSLRRGGIYAARHLPAACRQSSTAHKSLHPHQTIPTTRIHTTHLTLHLVVIQHSCTHIHLAQTSPSNFVEKIKKTCKNLLTKVILLAIIIKLSREPSPRRQPLKPLPTACTRFLKKTSSKNFQKTS